MADRANDSPILAPAKFDPAIRRRRHVERSIWRVRNPAVGARCVSIDMLDGLLDVRGIGRDGRVSERFCRAAARSQRQQRQYDPSQRTEAMTKLHRFAFRDAEKCLHPLRNTQKRRRYCRHVAEMCYSQSIQRHDPEQQPVLFRRYQFRRDQTCPSSLRNHSTYRGRFRALQPVETKRPCA